jgi:nitroreductase
MESADFHGFLASRTSVREYDGTPVREDDLSYIAGCASTAPSAGNRKAWDVVIVTDDEVLAALADAAFDQSQVKEAAVVFAVCANYVRSMSRYGERGILYAVQDATIACTYMMLAAHARGLRSCWTGAFDEDEVREIIDLPQHVRPVALLAVGHGGPNPGAVQRMATEEHIHTDIW